MATADILVGHHIEHPAKLPCPYTRRPITATGLDKDSVGQRQKWHPAPTRGTGLPQEIRAVSGGTDQTPTIRIMFIGLRMHGKANAAL